MPTKTPKKNPEWGRKKLKPSAKSALPSFANKKPYKGVTATELARLRRSKGER